MTTPVNSKTQTTPINGTPAEIDMTKVSKRVKDQVSIFQKMGGDTQKIDSEKEFEALRDFYRDNEKDLNNSEKLYLDNLKNDYLAGYIKEKFEEAEKTYQESITDYAKGLVAHIMGTENDENALDSKLEVDLLKEIRKNKDGELNAADIRYIDETLENVDPEFTRPEENFDGGQEPKKLDASKIIPNSWPPLNKSVRPEEYPL